MENKWQTVFLLAVTICIVPQIQSQNFNEAQKNDILRKHRQKLELESSRIFEGQLKWDDDSSRLQKLMNYEGHFEMVRIGNVQSYSMACSEHLGSLVGIDYKRHNNSHYLLCFSDNSLLIRSFDVQHNTQLNLDSHVNLVQVKGKLKHALFYRRYDSEQLFVAVLIHTGVYLVKTFAVINDKMMERSLGHEFKFGEQVSKIDVLHYGINQFKLVALLEGTTLAVEPDGEIVKLVMPRASHLNTMRLQTQGFIIGSNNSHWCAFSYTDQGPEMVVLYRSNSMIVDLKTIIIGNRHFIGVAAQFDQMIYRWDGSTFKGTAKTKLAQVYKMNTLSVSFAREDSFFYFDQPNQEMTSMFTYNFNKRQFSKLSEPLNRQLLGLPNLQFNSKYSNHFSDHNVAFELKLYGSMIHVFAYETFIVHNSDKKSRQAEEFEQFKERETIENKIGNMKQTLHKLETTETISKSNINITFTFNVRFNAALTTKRIEVLNNTTPSSWKINQNTFHKGQVLVHLDKLRGILPHVEDRNYKLKRELDSEVVYTTSSGHITGFKEFVNSVSAPGIEVKHSYVDMFRGQYVGDILSNLYRTSSDVQIKGTKMFAVDTSVNDQLQADRLNHVPPAHYFYGSLDQEVFCNFWYNRLSVDHLSIGDQLAPNISLSKTVFINQNGNQPTDIQNRVIFNDLNVNNLHVGIIDGLAMDKLPSQLLRKSEKQKQAFKVRTRMYQMNARSDVYSHSLNGRNASLVFANLVRKSGTSHFVKPVHFNGDVRFRFLETADRLNGIRVPDDLMDRFSDQTVHGIKKFSQATVKNLQTDILNGLRIPADIITLSRDEHIPGHLSVDALRVSANLLVEGLLDGINMTHLDQRYISTLKNNYHNLTFYQPVEVKWLKVQGDTNGVRIEDVYNDSIFNNSRSVYINSTKTVASMLRCESLEAGLVNGQNFDQFVSTYGQAFLSQRVIFKDGVQFGELKLSNMFDGVPVEEILQSVASLTGQNVIYGQKSFKEPVHVDRLVVHGSINRIVSSNFMLYSSEQNITGSKWFSDAHIGHLSSASNLHLKDSVNNHNFNQLQSSMIWLDIPRSLDAALFCANCSASQINTVYVNGKNFTYFKQNYLSKSTVQTIRGNKSFKGIQQFGEIKTRNGMVAGINMTRVRQDAVTLNGHNIIRNPVIFEGDLKLSNGRLTAEVFNNIDLNEYYSKVVRNNQSIRVQIIGRTIFNKGFDLHANIRTNTLNGFPPKELIMTTTGNYTIRSNVHFAGKVVTSGNVRVNANVNGLDLVHLDQNILKVNHRGEVEGSINFVQNVNVGQISVNGLVDGIPLNRSSLLMKHSQQNLNQMVLNGQAHFKQNINVWANINGFHQDNLNKIVLADSVQTQVINASKKFHHVEAFEIHQMKGDLHVKMINGVNLRQFEQNAVYSNTTRTVKAKQHFLQNVTLATRQVSVSGRVNNIDLLREVIRLDSINQTITGIKTFERINLNDDIEVHGHVNTVDLGSVQQNVLYNVGQQNIPKEMIFKAPVYLSRDSQVDNINNIKPSNLLTLSGNQQVNGQLRFGEMHVEQISSKLVNSVNLTDISEHVFYKKTNKPQILQGTIFVNNVQFDDDVALKYHLNNVDLNMAVETAKSSIHEKFDMKAATEKIRDYTNKLHDQRTQYEYASFEIDYMQPSRVPLNFSINSLKFAYKLDRRNAQVMFAQLASDPSASDANIAYQPFFFNGHSHVAVIYSNRDRSTLQILDLTWNQQLTTVYFEQFSPDFKPLVFAMDNAIHVLFGSQNSLDCRNQTKSFLRKLKQGAPHIGPVVQQFAEQNVASLGHFADSNDYHHLVFSSHQNGLEQQIKIYKRFDRCNFELLQTISAENVFTLALFKFGMPGLMEQYLVTMSNNKLTLWKQRGFLGFSQNWSTRVSLSPNTNGHLQLAPFIDEQSRLFIHAPSCSANAFQAILNGHFTNLQLFYDEFF